MNDGLLTAVCHRGCANGGQCIEPEVCECVDPYVGVTCRENKQGIVYAKLEQIKTYNSNILPNDQSKWGSMYDKADFSDKMVLEHQKVEYTAYAYNKSYANAGMTDHGE